MNSKMIAALGVDMPEEAEEVSSISLPEPIHPGELVLVDNPNLPEMEDIETTLVEGERQAEALIKIGFDMIKSLTEENPQIAPNYRNSHLERLIMAYQTTADMVKFKTELQLKKKKSRLDEAKFVGRGSVSKDGEDDNKGSTTVINNNFFQKDLIKMISDAKQVAENPDANFSDMVKNDQ